MKMTYKADGMDFSVGGKDYKVDVFAVGFYDYRPAVMYLRNGDPGYPEEETWEVDEVDAVWKETKEDGSEIEVEPTAEMEEALERWLYDLDWDEWDCPERDYEPPEPDYE